MEGHRWFGRYDSRRADRVEKAYDRGIISSVVVGCLVAMAVAVIASSNAAPASAACDPRVSFPARTNDHFTQYVSGSMKTSTSVTGVRSWIKHYPSFVPNAPPPSPGQPSPILRSMAYVQLVHMNLPPPAGASDSWVKAGYVRFKVDGSSSNLFAEYKNYHGSVGMEIFGFTSTTGFYEVLWNSGLMTVLLNGQSYGFVQFTSLDHQIPNRAQVFGYVDSRASQMPGAVNNRVRFSHANIRVPAGTWQPLAGTGFNSNNNWFGLDGISTSVLDIWDRACLN